MKRIYSFITLIAILVNAQTSNAQELVEAEFQLQYTTALIGFFGFPTPVEYAVDFYRVTYTTTDTDGQPTVASGAMAVPASGLCNSFPMTAYCHGTVLQRYDVPSEQNFEGFLTVALASAGYICVAPDYLGLGEDEGVHPYVHAESQATATLDLISAAREFLETIETQDNGEVFITGYSQGGHAAMAALKYAQDNELVEELGIVAGAPLSGPYDMSGSQADLILSDQPYSTPGYIIYLLVSYQSVYGNLYDELSDVIQDPYADIAAPYFDGEQDEFSMSVVNGLLPEDISELLRDSVLTNFENNPNHPLRVALADNDLFDWTPEMPLRMFYCDGDEQVAFTNSTTTEQIMNDNGAADVDSENVLPGADHAGCVEPALLAAFEFFEGLASECSSTLSTAEAKEEAITIWPNPARDNVQINFSLGNGQLSLYDVNGRLLKEQVLNSDLSTIDVSDLSDGNYILTITHNGANYGTLVVVKK
ncbi:MAG TPA: alpha/beta fold hydrolase [Cryomorphaceae bacterium]|nr:alpha/beta fold hydrolase [Cryomorphaceae bacterium]